MSSIAAVKAQLLEMIEAAEAKKRSLDSVISSLREALQQLNDVPAGSADFLQSHTQESQPESVPDASHDHQEMNWSHMQLQRDTQFRKIVVCFLDRENRSATIRDLAGIIGASRAAVANILYRTQKEAFTSQRVEGERRLRSWQLRHELYQHLLETR